MFKFPNITAWEIVYYNLHFIIRNSISIDQLNTESDDDDDDLPFLSFGFYETVISFVTDKSS